MPYRFFKTLREKIFVIKALKRGDFAPLCKYLLYRFRLSHLFYLRRAQYRMRVYYSPYAFWLWTHEDREKDEEVFFESFIQEGDIVVDCGAHLGTLTTIASKKVGAGGHVYAYEAHPRTFSFLRQTIHDNNCHNVTTSHVAIGNDCKQVSVTNLYVNDMNTITTEKEISVAMKTLDFLLKEVPYISLLKLDIEGYELFALEGAITLLDRTKAIYFESAEKSFNDKGYSLSNVISFLKKYDFVCYHTDGDRVMQPVSEGYITKSRYENILAKKQ